MSRNREPPLSRTVYRFIKPSAEYEQSYRGYISELGNSERYPFPLDYPFDDFQALVSRLDNYSRGVELPKGIVPNSTFWLLEHGEIVGVSNLRHTLTEKLQREGGHIGFGVRPTSQGRGIGKELLKRTLEEARNMGITEILIVCQKENIASARVISANGGVLDAEYSIPGYSGPVQRYVVGSKHER